ncbi:hypothetical protein [Gemmatimonas sp.]|uniref:hypothetical protein n=1 Tax=Gemmatimonas sp. TaxID=1962908 RepID=UPI00333E1997
MREQKVTGYRIDVQPRGLGDFGFASVGTGLLYGHGEDARQRILRDEKERCDDIAQDIRRHVDNVRRVTVEEETEAVCSFCGHAWTEESTTYNGGCCDADEANNPTPNAGAGR